MTASLLSRLSDNYPFREEDDYPWASQPYETLLNELKMLLTSRARLPDIENIPQINASVLNYGIDESFSKINETGSRRLMMETRLKNTISRFEPRLTQISLTSNMNDSNAIYFILRGIFFLTPIELNLIWNDCTGRFYFNE